MDSDFALGLAAVTLAVDVCNTEILCWKNGIIHDTWISSLNQKWKISGLCFSIELFILLSSNPWLPTTFLLSVDAKCTYYWNTFEMLEC